MRCLRPFLVVMSVVALAGCTGATHDIGTQPPGTTHIAAGASTASVVTTDAPVLTPTPAPTPGSPSVAITKKIIHAWVSSASYVRYQVIVEVHNSGTGWADMVRGSSDYTVYDKTGGVTDTGSFVYAYPRYLGPGETGYLLDDGITDNAKVADFVTVDATGQYKELDQAGPKLTTDKIKLKADSYGGTVSVTGTVTNTDSAAVTSAVIGVVMFDAAGNPLCFDYTNLVDNIAAGQTKGFSATGSMPIKLSQIKSTLAFASSMDY